MNHRFKIILTLTLSSLSAWGSGTLIENSPFIPPGFSPDATAVETPMSSQSMGDQIEFRGYYKLDSAYYFLLGEKKSGQGKWVKMDPNSAGDGEFQVQQFDPESDRVKVKYNATVGWLELQDEVSFSGVAGSANAQRQASLSSSTRLGGVTRSVSPTSSISRARPSISSRSSGTRITSNARAGGTAGIPGLMGRTVPGRLPRGQVPENMEIPTPSRSDDSFLSNIPTGKPPSPSPEGIPGPAPDMQPAKPPS